MCLTCTHKHVICIYKHQKLRARPSFFTHGWDPTLCDYIFSGPASLLTALDVQVWELCQIQSNWRAYMHPSVLEPLCRFCGSFTLENQLCAPWCTVQYCLCCHAYGLSMRTMAKAHQWVKTCWNHTSYNCTGYVSSEMFGYRCKRAVACVWHHSPVSPAHTYHGNPSYHPKTPPPETRVY